jgi:CRISPR-associated exonuclease Cas4
MVDEFLIKSKLTGTKIAYYIVCKRKLWLFSNHITFENSSDLVQLGKLISENSFRREKQKEVLLGDTIKIDFIKTGEEIVVHEVKKSKKLEEAHIWQVKLYIYVLKKMGIKCSSGVIHYPKLMRKIEVELKEMDEEFIERISNEIDKILGAQIPPPIKVSYCRKCAYYQFCYV